MAEYTLSDFDKNKIQQGASVGFQKDGKTLISTRIYLYPNGSNMYMGNVTFDNNQHETYEFDFAGYLYDANNKEVGILYIVDSTINMTQGSIVTRVDDAEVFTISSLQPREEIAMHCLESMLTTYIEPLNIDNTKIKQLVGKSFMFAQEFINQAVEYRKKETSSSTTDSDKKVNVDSSSLSSDTDKILYNIQVALTNWMAQNKNQYADQQKNGLKLAATDINVKTMPDTVNTTTKVSGEMTITGFPAPEVNVTVPVPSVTVNNNIPSSGGTESGS